MEGENTGEIGCRSLAQNGHGLGLERGGHLLFYVRISRAKLIRVSVQLQKYLECWGEGGWRKGQRERDID